MQETSITKATQTDIETLTKIGGRTYSETFANCYYAKEMRDFYNQTFNEQSTTRQLQNPNSQFFIAWKNTQPVGYLKINTAGGQTELNEPDSIEIERMYVLEAYQGKQIGKLLFQKAEETARMHRKTSIWFKIWEQKAKTVRFFQNNGFVIFDEEVFTAENKQQTNLFMRKKL